MKGSLKQRNFFVQKPKKHKIVLDGYSLIKQKEAYLTVKKKTGFFYVRRMKQWYKQNRQDLWFKVRLRRKIRFLTELNVRFKFPSVVRWILVDFLRAKPRKFWGIYQFVALPGEGKTLSMVAHMERVRKELGKENVYIATNFCYKNEDTPIKHWTDMIKASKHANDHKMHSVIALDEIHTTFDASDWKSFPAEMLALLSFNRKFGMQFLCSAQIYDRIPRKVRDIANYTVICKNTMGLDRHFVNFYFTKSDYEDKFNGKRRSSEFIRTYVAGDNLYALYDTLQQVDNMTSKAMDEQTKQKEAFQLLFRREEATEIGAD